MSHSLISADTKVVYQPKEAAVMVVGLAWLIMLGSSAAAAIIVCGWRGAKSITMDWLRMRATFTCR